MPLGSAIGLALGTLGGVALAIVRARSVKITQPGETAIANLPELGVILSARDSHALKLPHRNILGLPQNSELGLATWHQDSSLFAESFRSTLASILFRSELPADRALGPGWLRSERALIITSMDPSEGKTTVVANLGVAFAETKRRVLLIDADMRRPRLHSIFNICNDWGLSDLIQSSDNVSELDFSKMARPTQVPGLSILPSGPGADGISKLLYSSRLDELVAGFRKEFDLILVDTPPIRLYPDARVLGRMSDGVIFVVRANKTSRDDVKSWRQVLVQDGTPVLGMILNDCRMQATHYGPYSSYYNRDAKNA
jgi:capsular exopolysaccharide synthesis family protein